MGLKSPITSFFLLIILNLRDHTTPLKTSKNTQFMLTIVIHWQINYIVGRMTKAKRAQPIIHIPNQDFAPFQVAA